MVKIMEAIEISKEDFDRYVAELNAAFPEVKWYHASGIIAGHYYNGPTPTTFLTICPREGIVHKRGWLAEVPLGNDRWVSGFSENPVLSAGLVIAAMPQQ